MIPPFKLKWHNGVSIPQAESISRDVWEDHREIIERKYHQLTLDALIQWMKDEHNFHATRSQYNHQFARWGLKKRRLTSERDSVLSLQDQPAQISSLPLPPQLSSSDSSPHKRTKILDVAELPLKSNPSSDTTLSRIPFRDSMIPPEIFREFLDSIDESSNEMPELVPESWTGERIGDLWKSLPAKLFSKYINPLQDRAEYFFYMGHQHKSYDLYRKAWSASRVSLEPEEVKTLLISACIRSVANKDQLMHYIESDASLRSIYMDIMQIATANTYRNISTSVSLRIDSVHTFIRFLSILEICQRISLPSPIPNLTFDKNVVEEFRNQMHNFTTQTKFLAWYYLQRLPNHHNILPCIFQDLENPVEHFLESEEGHELLRSCLKWLEKVIRDHMNETYMIESTTWTHFPWRKKKSLPRYEIELFRFLFRQWRQETSSTNGYALNYIGVTLPHLFKAIAVLVVKQAQCFPDCSGLWDAINYLQYSDIDVLSSRVLQELSYVWSNRGSPDVLTAPSYELAPEINRNIGFSGDLTAFETLQSSTKEDLKYHNDHDNLWEPEQHIHARNIRRRHTNPCDPGSKDSMGSKVTPLTAIKICSNSDLSLGQSLLGSNFQESNRNSMGALKSPRRANSWNLSLRSSDRSFGSFKAMKERLEDLRASRVSHCSQMSFLSLLRHVFNEDGHDMDINRLSADFNRTSLQSEDEEERLSKDYITKITNNVVIVDSEDEGD